MNTELGAFCSDPAKVAAVVRTAGSIFERWGLSNAEIRQVLGGMTVKDLLARPELPEEQARRLGWILGIHRTLRTLFPTARVADSWLDRENRHPLFGGKPARERLVSGHMADLEAIFNYLRAQTF